MNVGRVALVAGREVREQVRGKALWVSTVIFVVAIVAVIVLPVELSSGRPTERVAVAAPVPPGVVAAIKAVGPVVGAHVEVSVVGNDSAARLALLARGTRRADVVVLEGPPTTILIDQALPAGSTSAIALLADAVSRQVGIVRAVTESGLPTAQADALVNPSSIPVRHIRPPPASSQRRGAAIAGTVLFFLLVQRYGFGLLSGVIQEKSGRVVELLLQALSPVELLVGKVVGSGLMVLAQATVFVVAALVSAGVVGSSILHGSGAGAIVVSFVWIVIGFSFYATLFAAGGSLASKPEDTQSVGLPLQLPLLVGYVLAFSTLGSGSANGLVKVLAYLPPTAPLDMPVLAATGGAGGLDVALSMALCLAGTVVVARLGAKVFARSILHTGGRLKARDVLRAAPGTSSAAPVAQSISAARS